MLKPAYALSLNLQKEDEEKKKLLDEEKKKTDGERKKNGKFVMSVPYSRRG